MVRYIADNRCFTYIEKHTRREKSVLYALLNLCNYVVCSVIYWKAYWLPIRYLRLRCTSLMRINPILWVTISSHLW